MTKPQLKAKAKTESDRQIWAHRTAALKKKLTDTFVVVDGRGGISVDLDRMLSSEKGKRSIEKLRRVPIQKK